MGDFSNLSRFLAEVSEKHGPSGNGCIVMRDGEVLFEEYHGFANREKGIRTDADTLYRQFSTSKISTCTAALTLFEQGKYLMNDPLYDYIPEWKDAQIAVTLPNAKVEVRPLTRPILVRDLFSMSIGLGYNGPDLTHRTMDEVRAELEARDGGYTVVDFAKALAKVPVAFEPGSHFLYGVGHDILAGFVEIVSGKKFGEYLKETIFEPLGMEHTGHRFEGKLQADKLTTMYLYDEKTGGTVPTDYYNGDENHAPGAIYEGGGSGLLSTVSDYGRLMQMLALGGTYRGEHILGRKTVDMMGTNRLGEMQLKDFRNKYLDGFGYGFGVRTLIDKAPGNNASIGTFGWTGMAGTLAECDPSERLSYVYMHNMVPNNERYIHPRIRNIIYGSIE